MGKCFVCGIPTPLGLRAPGPRSSVPDEKRDKYLRFCADHRADAFARRDAATGISGSDARPVPAVPQQQPSRGRKVDAPAPDARQKGLFE